MLWNLYFNLPQSSMYLFRNCGISWSNRIMCPSTILGELIMSTICLNKIYNSQTWFSSSILLPTSTPKYLQKSIISEADILNECFFWMCSFFIEGILLLSIKSDCKLWIRLFKYSNVNNFGCILNHYKYLLLNN